MSANVRGPVRRLPNQLITCMSVEDRTTRRPFESIRAQQEEHTEDLVDLLEDLPKD